MKGTENGDRFNRCESEIGFHVSIYTEQAEHLQFHLFASAFRCFKLIFSEMPNAQHGHFSCFDLGRDFIVTSEFVADRCPNEVGSVGENAFPHKQVDRPQVHEPEVDRDFLAIGNFPDHDPSLYHLKGWSRDGDDGFR